MRKLIRWFNVRVWDRTHIPFPEVEDDFGEFWQFTERGDVIPTLEAVKELFTDPEWKEPTDEQNKHMESFTHFEKRRERTPLSPRSGLLMPKLSQDEVDATRLDGPLRGFFDGEKITLSPELFREKLEERSKGEVKLSSLTQHR